MLFWYKQAVLNKYFANQLFFWVCVRGHISVIIFPYN
jgi:hypothetical protein